MADHDVSSTRRPTHRARRHAAGAAALLLFAAACGSGGESEPTEPVLPADADTIVDAAAEAMGATESVRFMLNASGSPVFIDQFEEIALTQAVGVFRVPGAAQAVLDVEVSGNLNTQLGAVALDDEVWLSNPITGNFETLPPGYDLDPSRFFDPENGWRPLMENLVDITLVGLEEDDGVSRYIITATAPAEQIEIITAGLVRGQDVDVEFRIQPVTGNVRVAEFTTATPQGDVDWRLALDDFGAELEIEPPEGVER